MILFNWKANGTKALLEEINLLDIKNENVKDSNKILGAQAFGKQGLTASSPIFLESVAVRFWLGDGYLPAGDRAAPSTGKDGPRSPGWSRQTSGQIHQAWSVADVFQIRFPACAGAIPLGPPPRPGAAADGGGRPDNDHHLDHRADLRQRQLDHPDELRCHHR